MPTLSSTTPFYGGAQLILPVRGLTGTNSPPTKLQSAWLRGQTTFTNVTTQTVYMLTSVNPVTWTILGGATSVVDSLTPDTGTSPVVPAANTITLAGGTGLTTVGGTNVMTFNVIGGGVKTIDVASATQTLAPNTGYVADDGATLVTFTLPPATGAGSAALGDLIRITGRGTGLWTIAQNANQKINMNSVSTTTGVGGSLASTARYNSVELLCTIAGANTEFTVISSEGTLTVT